MNYDDYKKYLVEADTRMKASNGHSFVQILKIRCQYCGRSPNMKGKCRRWFQTFVDHLGSILWDKGIIQSGAKS